MQSHTYLEYYTEYVSRLPLPFTFFSMICRYCLCFFLATMPSKKVSAFVIAAFVLSTVPDLIVGKRGVTITALFLGLIYYMMRDYYNSGGERWLGKKEKGFMIVSAPFMLIFLAAYRYIRTDVNITNFNPFMLLVDFFYSQGGSFGWLCSGLGVYNKLPDGVISYTFGSFIDYLKHSRTANLLWGGEILGDGSNNLLRATLGNNLGHHLSYVLLGNQYFRGEGVGSSYILEVFIDFGYVGVAIFCLILGIVSMYSLRFAQKGVVQFSLVLIAINGILMMPRGSAMMPFDFLIRSPFLLAFALCFGYSLLLASFHKSRAKPTPATGKHILTTANDVNGASQS